MSKTETVIATFWIGVLLTFTVLFFSDVYSDKDEKKIKNGKQFIMGNATYICKKTNELKEVTK